MKGLKLTLLVFLATFSFIQADSGSQCESSDQCLFNGECVDDECLCNTDCSALGFLVLCGDDGRYYLNFCYLTMASCERQAHIGINKIGYSENCSTHRLHSAVSSLRETLPDYLSCQHKSNHCENYGVCVQQNPGTQFCFCPPRLGGSRCQDKVDSTSPNYVVRGRPRAMVGEDIKGMLQSDVIVTLTLCIVSALFSAVVTATICSRYKDKKMRKFAKEIRRKQEEYWFELKSIANDSPET